MINVNIKRELDNVVKTTAWYDIDKFVGQVELVLTNTCEYDGGFVCFSWDADNVPDTDIDLDELWENYLDCNDLVTIPVMEGEDYDDVVNALRRESHFFIRYTMLDDGEEIDDSIYIDW